MAERGLGDFIAEATEILEVLGGELLQLEAGRGGEADPARLNAVFRAAHSLKGLAALFGVDRIAHLAHAAEDLLERLRLGRAPLDAHTLDRLLEALEVLNALLASLARGERSPALEARVDAVAARLQEGGTPEAGTGGEDPLEQLALAPEVRAVFTAYEEHRLREAVRAGRPLYRVRAVYGLSDFDVRLTALTARLEGLGERISTLPAGEPGPQDTIGFDLLVAARGGVDLAAALADAALAVEPLALRPLQPQAPVEPEAPLVDLTHGVGEGSLRSLARTVRVDIDRLDVLMNQVGELLVTRSNLQRLVEAARSQAAPAGSLFVQELARTSRQLERGLQALRAGLLGARMVPLAQVFERLARLVRRVAREAGKELELVVSGGEVELDKLIVEGLSDPLMHLIRNALDHGVEAPSVRAARGKPRRGRVSLRAWPRGNHVVLEVEDDGAGMDPERLKAEAVQRGLLTPGRAAELSAGEALHLVFLPGLSTAREVSSLSGRGVGLDVVKTNLAHLSGVIDVWSEPGRGTRFTLTLPVTLAILRALVVAVSGRTYALPLNSVLEILPVEPGALRTEGRQQVLPVRGQTVPLVHLSRLLGLPARPGARQYAVLVGLAQQRLALGVEALVGEQDIVTKPLPPRLQGVRGICGATELGDRRTVLVLDVAALLEEGLALGAGPARATGS